MHLKCDVLLLADVLEKFRNNSIKNYGLCPNHFLRASALRWMQCLIWQKYIFFEKGMRDGVSYISNRCSKANNKYLKSYDSKQESKHIIYLDANNLYG